MTDVPQMSGEANVAVIRGQVKMGYDVSVRAEFKGHEKSRFCGVNVLVDIAALCDDGGDLEEFKF